MADNKRNFETDLSENETNQIIDEKQLRMLNLEKSLQDIGTHLSIILELAVAVLVFVASIISILHLFPELYAFFNHGGTSAALIEFLEEVFVVVIGIEFLKMLCKPTSDNVLETIIFLVARHMIINQTNPLDDLFSVIAIVLLVLVKKYLKLISKKNSPLFLFRREKSDKTED